jgi:hypothetical protein
VSDTQKRHELNCLDFINRECPAANSAAIPVSIKVATRPAHIIPAAHRILAASATNISIKTPIKIVVSFFF